MYYEKWVENHSFYLNIIKNNSSSSGKKIDNKFSLTLYSMKDSDLLNTSKNYFFFEGLYCPIYRQLSNFIFYKILFLLKIYFFFYEWLNNVQFFVREQLSQWLFISRKEFLFFWGQKKVDANFYSGVVQRTLPFFLKGNLILNSNLTRQKKNTVFCTTKNTLLTIILKTRFTQK